jgi:hypothetical protein
VYVCVCEDGFRPGAQVGVGVEIGSRRIRKKREQKRAEDFEGQRTIYFITQAKTRSRFLCRLRSFFTFLTIGC